PVAMLFFITAFAIERLRFPNDSRYFYPIAVVLTLLAFTGLAAQHHPYREWMERNLTWTRGQLEYLFIRSEERRVGKESTYTRSKRDWSSDVCSSDLAGGDAFLYHRIRH